FPGIPGITIVGLPDNAVNESKERIKFAIKNSGYEYPIANKIVVNLSPADVRKEGSSLDLPIAVGILKNKSGMTSSICDNYLFYGELNLNGELNPVKGVLNVAIYAKKNGFAGIVIPYKNGNEASFVKEIDVYALNSLNEVMEFIINPGSFKKFIHIPQKVSQEKAVIDFSEIKGQYLAKRIMEIASAGFHNVLMAGPPGSGKSMISKALPSILPPMTDEEILETSLIYSAAGLLNNHKSLVITRPFRSPHHTISDVGISGGGKYPAPGEISLSHNGILFLDELPYFKKSALEVLRQPLEDGEITISRSLTSYTYPAKFMLVAAMNPCEDSIGLKDSEFHRCTEAEKRRYYARISKPLLDRIDLQIEVKKVAIDEITSNRPAESSAAVRARVIQARNIQLERFKQLNRDNIFANGQMTNVEIKKFCILDHESERLLKLAVEKLNLSARSYFKILKIARTIADLSGDSNICQAHIQESLQYRTLDLYRL
ncbi:MAG: YifB family Mg chelatase-like AAA ATPase, partial [Acidobacteria bacterium]|nr:YifB family Mg chelatase-like AAA ATPase [Acidobacteriota bacterium]